MHGFVNVLFAAVLCAAGSRHQDQLERVLDERNPRAFAMESDGIRWRDAVVSNADCADARAQLLRSVGSCSFEEPIADLRDLGWWPSGFLTSSDNSQLPTPNSQVNSEPPVPNRSGPDAMGTRRVAVAGTVQLYFRRKACKRLRESGATFNSADDLPRLTARLVHGTPEQRPDVVPPQVVCLKRLIHRRPEVFTGSQPSPGLFGRIHRIRLRARVPLRAAAGSRSAPDSDDAAFVRRRVIRPADRQPWRSGRSRPPQAVPRRSAAVERCRASRTRSGILPPHATVWACSVCTTRRPGS